LMKVIPLLPSLPSFPPSLLLSPLPSLASSPTPLSLPPSSPSPRSKCRCQDEAVRDPVVRPPPLLCPVRLPRRCLRRKAARAFLVPGDGGSVRYPSLPSSLPPSLFSLLHKALVLISFLHWFYRAHLLSSRPPTPSPPRRMPYFSYISMLHLYETLGWWTIGTDVRRVHFAEGRQGGWEGGREGGREGRGCWNVVP
jgi:hypothetical protein